MDGVDSNRTPHDEPYHVDDTYRFHEEVDNDGDLVVDWDKSELADPDIGNDDV